MGENDPNHLGLRVPDVDQPWPVVGKVVHRPLRRARKMPPPAWGSGPTKRGRVSLRASAES
jgi:hypothetical protein